MAVHCDVCGNKFRREHNGMPIWVQYYKGMPFNCCQSCWQDEKAIELIVEPNWLR